MVTLLSGLITVNLNAQEKRKLTLQEAVLLGIQNSKQVKLNKSRIDEAVAAVQEAKDRRLPDVEMSGSYLRVNNPNISMKNSKTDNSGGSQEQRDMSVSQALYGMASVSMPIYSGSRIRYGIEASQLLEKAVRLDAEHDQEGVVMNIIDAYIGLYKATRAVELMKENLEKSRARDRDLSNLEKNGLLARNDLLKAQLQTSNYELALLDAESNHKLACVTLNILMGFPDSVQPEADSISLDNQASLRSVEEYEQLAIQNRKDLKALQVRRQAADLSTKSVHAEYYPSVGLTAGYVAADIPGFLSVTNAVNAGVGVKYNFSSLWKTKAKVQQSLAQERQLEVQTALLGDQVKIGISKAYQNYLLSVKKIDVYATAIEQAKENFRITKNKFDNNLVTTTDLLDADVSLLEARLNQAFAKADALAAWYKLQQTAGLMEAPNGK